jgi:multidrug efflux pump subunit AcrA (membrane-fusion protein)
VPRPTLALALLAAILVGCNAPAPAPALAAPVAHRPAAAEEARPRRVELEAVISFRDGPYEQVTARTWGRVKRVLVQVGAHVRPSDPLFEIEAPAPPSLARARAELTAAEHDLRRQEELGESMRAVEDGRCLVERARRELERARHGTGVPQETTLVRAAVEAEVVELRADADTVVEATEISACGPTDIAILADVARMRATSVGPPPKLSAFGWTPAAGAEAMLRIPRLPGKTFAGRVLSWDAERVVAEIDNPERLLQDGMRGLLVVEGPPQGGDGQSPTPSRPK